MMGVEQEIPEPEQRVETGRVPHQAEQVLLIEALPHARVTIDREQVSQNAIGRLRVEETTQRFASSPADAITDLQGRFTRANTTNTDQRFMLRSTCM